MAITFLLFSVIVSLQRLHYQEIAYESGGVLLYVANSGRSARYRWGSAPQHVSAARRCFNAALARAKWLSVSPAHQYNGLCPSHSGPTFTVHRPPGSGGAADHRAGRHGQLPAPALS